MSLFRDSSFYVVGLARTGRHAVDFLLSMQAEVFVWDDDDAALKDLPEDVIIISPHAAYGSGVYDRLHGVLLTPGIGDDHEAADYAMRAEVPLISDISLFAAACPDIHNIALTGTNGKSTVCLLIEHVLKSCGVLACASGNIGFPILREENIAMVSDNPLFVLELSSYQIDRLHSPIGFAEDLMGAKEFACDVAILLNLAKDHLERYGTMENYAASKEHLFDYLSMGGLAVVGVDDEYSLQIFERLKKRGIRTVPISGVTVPDGGVGMRDGKLWDADAGGAVLDLSSLPYLSGSHNVQNLAASYACLREYNLNKKSLLSAMESFRPLPHRQEFVDKKGDVIFINDSKATNSAAVLPAFLSYEKIYWLAGGVLKETDLSPLDEGLGNVRGGYFFGLDGDKLLTAFTGKILCSLYNTMEDALKAAYKDAVAAGEGQGEGAGKRVVLLSPAGASFDGFANFEERGDVFKELVKTLPKHKK